MRQEEKDVLRKKWLEARKNGIGASEASCIIGVNPWKSNTELWREKTGKSEAENIDNKECVKYGKQAEMFVREIFMLDYPQLNVEYDEFAMIANRESEPWLFATLDGHLISENRDGVLEIKTTTIQNNEQWKHWDDKVPDYYYVQILHQLLATGYEFAILRADIRYYKGKELRHTVRDYHFESGEESIQADMEYLLKEEKKFWDCVQRNLQPNLILPEI